MENELISVIVPVYNCEKYLGQCVDSILSQTYENIELILVDDGSTDGSPGICDDYRSRDARVKVIHKANGGVSSTRNRGIEEASGKYIVFCDSDDWVEEDMIEHMYEPMVKYGVGLIYTGFCKYSEKMGYNLSNHRLTGSWSVLLTSREKIALLFGVPRTSLTAVSVWAKMYRADIIKENNIRFPEDVKYEEDCVFNTQYYRHINNAIALPDIDYHYRQLDVGLSRNYSVEGFRFLVNGYNERIKLYNEIGLDNCLRLLDSVFIVVTRTAFIKASRAEIPASDKKSIYKEMMQIPEVIGLAVKGKLAKSRLTRYLYKSIDKQNEDLIYIVLELWKFVRAVKQKIKKVKFFADTLKKRIKRLKYNIKNSVKKKDITDLDANAE